MTNEEAIKYGRKQLEISDSEHAEFIKLSLEALEQQTPKKPDFEGDGYTDGEMVYEYDTWICPACGEEYGVEYIHYDYCLCCGQHIDWSEGEKE